MRLGPAHRTVSRNADPDNSGVFTPGITRRQGMGLLLGGVAFAASGFLACSRAGSTAPPFATTTQYGRVLRNEDFRGRTLLLNLWATWCPHCRSQLAAMDQIASSYAAGRVSFLALSIDREGWNVVRPYLAETGFSLSVGLADRATQRAYGASGGIPITWVIDPSGIVVTDIPGALDAQSLREVIDQYAG